MLPSQHHASFSIALKRFMISLYARLMSFPHKINPLDYAMNLSFINDREERSLLIAPPFQSRSYQAGM